MRGQDEDEDFEVHLEAFAASDRKRYDVMQVVAKAICSGFLANHMPALLANDPRG